MTAKIGTIRGELGKAKQSQRDLRKAYLKLREQESQLVAALDNLLSTVEQGKTPSAAVISKYRKLLKGLYD